MVDIYSYTSLWYSDGMSDFTVHTKYDILSSLYSDHIICLTSILSVFSLYSLYSSISSLYHNLD